VILIHPFAQTMRNGMLNPKTPPTSWWQIVLAALKERDVVQLGVNGDQPLIPTATMRTNRPFSEIRSLVQHCAYWIAVDSFLPHLAHHVGKPGVVIWSQSDPVIFGYQENLNLLKDRTFLRPRQFGVWEAASYRPEAFLEPAAAVAAIAAWQRGED
jgi:ADP-heptose:LPS heptosyltransferase